MPKNEASQMPIIHPGLMQDVSNALKKALKTVSAEIQTKESNTLNNALANDFKKDSTLQVFSQLQQETGLERIGNASSTDMFKLKFAQMDRLEAKKSDLRYSQNNVDPARRAELIEAASHAQSGSFNNMRAEKIKSLSGSHAPKAVNSLDKETLSLCRVVLNLDKTATNSTEYHDQVSNAVANYGEHGRLFNSAVNPATKSVVQLALNNVLKSNKYNSQALKTWDKQTENSYAMMGDIRNNANANYQNYIAQRGDMAIVDRNRQIAACKNFSLEIPSSAFPSNSLQFSRNLHHHVTFAAASQSVDGWDSDIETVMSSPSNHSEKKYCP